MDSLTDVLRHSEPFRRICARLDARRPPLTLDLTAVHGSAHGCFLAALAEEMSPETTLLAVFPTQTEARKTYLDLVAFGARAVGFFPLLPDVLSESAAESRKSLRAERIQCLDLLRRGGVVVTSAHAAAQRLPAQVLAHAVAMQVRVGDTAGFQRLTRRLAEHGYRRAETLELKGEFAIRGGIVDVFPLTAHHPLRIEFFDDDVDSIRRFDETTQRSMESVPEAAILPAREFSLTDDARRQWLVHTGARYGQSPSRRLRSHIGTLTEQLFDTGSLEDIETYYPFLASEWRTLADALPETAIVYVNEPRWMEREMARFAERYRRLADDCRSEERLWVCPEEAFEPMEALWERFASHAVLRAAASQAGTASGEAISLATAPIVEQKGSLQKFVEGAGEWLREGYRVAVWTESAKAGEQMLAVLSDHGVRGPLLSVHEGWLSDGFLSDALRLVVIPQDAIFGRHRMPHRQSRFRDGRPLLSLVELSEGDCVVHVTHGIGKYQGIRRLRVGDEEHDFLMLQYAGSDVLYVPTYNMNLVQKFVGGGEAGPALDRLGGTSWARAKARAKASVERLAKELLALYAARQTTEGFAFSPDTPWQKEFEAAFPYEETPDQLRAIEDVKSDMERDRPMDRLLCGDVGYGKTEVAVRAAFKAVMDGKQAAVLVPTTVLALQHFTHFSERFREYPIRVRLLSRFVPPAETQATLDALRKGLCDVVVGTHRLLSRDVVFRDLGVLVVDEEHRFGVRHKERVKQLRKQVDVLTMTATPIPRTLHMAMTGVRDMSLINTPPENRLPIETYVMEYSPEVVREAILRELARRGQVFFVHNRVESIDSIARGLQELVPEARLCVGHGQLSERALEDTMLRFVRHEYDALVCTTIIESGLDIPNVNTILINRADALGLAQLYQLRGRVGRSDRRAYGYLFYAEDRAMTEESHKRLRVIEEFTELGSGFKIALRDLEIRGAGNLLGPEQHGHIAVVGYDLYCRLLENAIAELKGEAVEEEVEAQIRLPVAAYLPDEYVPETATKMGLYKRMATIRDRFERDALEREMRDRYGPLPDLARNLLDVALLKALASHLGITSVRFHDGRVHLAVDSARTRLDPQRVLALIQDDPDIRLAPPSQLSVSAPPHPPAELFAALFRVLRSLADDPGVIGHGPEAAARTTRQ